MVAVLIDDSRTASTPARRPVAEADPAPVVAGVPMPTLPLGRVALVVVALVLAVSVLRVVQGGPGDATVPAVESRVAGETVVEVMPGDTYESVAARLGAAPELADLLARRNGGLEPRAGTYLVVPVELSR